VQDFRGGQPVEQFIWSDAIGHVAAARQKRDRTTACVDLRVDFCRPPAARAADRLIVLPFPPEAQR
jgi:hypothetical protein